MKTQHTPGPWKAIGDKIYSADQRQVAHVYALVDPDDLNIMQSIPNARLMAAAPEMLDALKALIHAYSSHEFPALIDARERAKELIAKLTAQ